MEQMPHPALERNGDPTSHPHLCGGRVHLPALHLGPQDGLSLVINKPTATAPAAAWGRIGT